MKGFAALIVIGLIICYIGWFTIPVVGMVGLTMILIGCYLWTKEKERHWIFMFWELMAPIGLLGIALLRDKSWENTIKQPVNMSTFEAKEAANAIIKRNSIAGYQDTFSSIYVRLEEKADDQESVELLNKIKEINSRGLSSTGTPVHG